MCLKWVKLWSVFSTDPCSIHGYLKSVVFFSGWLFHGGLSVLIWAEYFFKQLVCQRNLTTSTAAATTWVAL